MPIRVLLRRTLWLLHCWVSAVPRTVRNQLYALFPYCFRHADKAVALTAVEAFTKLMEDVDFVASDVTPVFDGLMEGLFVSFSSAEMSDSKTAILNLISLLMNAVRELALSM